MSLIVTTKTKIKPESLPKVLLTKRLFRLGPVNIPKEFSSFTSVGNKFTKKIPNAKNALDQYISPIEAETEYRDQNTDEFETGYSRVLNKHTIPPAPKMLFEPPLPHHINLLFQIFFHSFVPKLGISIQTFQYQNFSNKI